MNDPVVNIKDAETIKCSNCNKKLMIINNSNGGEVCFELRVQCPYCNDFSFEKPIYGPIKYVPDPSLMITNFEQDPANVKKVKFLTKKRSV